MSIEGRLTRASAQRPAEPVKRLLASHAHLKLNTRTKAVKNSHKTVNRETLELNRFVCAKGRPRLYESLCSLIRSRTTAWFRFAFKSADPKTGEAQSRSGMEAPFSYALGVAKSRDVEQCVCNPV